MIWFLAVDANYRRKHIAEKISEKAKNIRKPPIVLGFIGDSVTQGCFEIYEKHTGGIETEFRSYEAFNYKLKKCCKLFFRRFT